MANTTFELNLIPEGERGQWGRKQKVGRWVLFYNLQVFYENCTFVNTACITEISQYGPSSSDHQLNRRGSG